MRPWGLPREALTRCVRTQNPRSSVPALQTSLPACRQSRPKLADRSDSTPDFLRDGLRECRGLAGWWQGVTARKRVRRRWFRHAGTFREQLVDDGLDLLGVDVRAVLGEQIGD